MRNFSGWIHGLFNLGLHGDLSLSLFVQHHTGANLLSVDEVVDIIVHIPVYPL